MVNTWRESMSNFNTGKKYDHVVHYLLRIIVEKRKQGQTQADRDHREWPETSLKPKLLPENLPLGSWLLRWGGTSTSVLVFTIDILARRVVLTARTRRGSEIVASTNLLAENLIVNYTVPLSIGGNSKEITKKLLFDILGLVIQCLFRYSYKQRIYLN